MPNWKKLIVSGSAGSLSSLNVDNNISASSIYLSGSTNVAYIEGSGSTIFEIQGSEGQLFSITDDLTEDLFAVADIFGVPILSVSGSGLVEVDGDLTANSISSSGAITGSDTYIDDWG